MIDVKLISIWFGRFDWIESIFSKPFICSQFVFGISWKCHVKPVDLKRNYRVRFLWCARWSIIDGRLAWARHENIGNAIIIHSFNGKDELHLLNLLLQNIDFMSWCTLFHYKHKLSNFLLFTGRLSIR